MKPYKYYIATVKYGKQLQDKLTKDGTPKLTYIKEDYLVNSVSIANAEKTLHALLTAVYQVFQIISIKQSNICGIVNEIENLFTSPEGSASDVG